MKVLILTPVWRRPDVTRIWADWLKMSLPPDVEVLTILSPEDEFFKENRAICSDFQRCLYKNQPLGEKINAGISYALTLEWDCLMNLGSDDLLHPAIWNLYKPYMDEGLPFVGLKQVYFFDLEKAILGHSKEYFWGAGRIINREVIEKIVNSGELVYTSKFERGLDHDSMTRIVKFTGNSYTTVDTGNFPYVLDIKTFDSLNDFDFNLHLMDIVGNKILLKHYPKFITDSLCMNHT